MKLKLFWWGLVALGIVLPLVNGAYYNTTNLTNAENIYTQALALNVIVDNLIGYALLFIVFFITFTIMTTKSGIMAGLTSASFIALLTATMLLPLQFISFTDYNIVLVLTGLSVAISLLVKSGG